MKIWERVVQARLRGKVTNSKQHHGVVLRRSTTDVMFTVRVLMEKHREGRTQQDDAEGRYRGGGESTSGICSG